MKWIASLLTIAVLSSCGVDGAPVKPTAGIGIGIGPNGVTTSTNVGVKKGNVSVGVSL